MKEEFKSFVKSNPQLVSHVNYGQMTWQKFYEMYELYGDQHEVWQDYQTKLTGPVSSSSSYTGADFMNMVKSMDSNKVKKGITSAQKFLNALQGFVKDDAKSVITPKASNYVPRPIYRHFED